MFGLNSPQDKKKKKPEEFVYDLEKEVQDPKRLSEILQNIEKKTTIIQNEMRSGVKDIKRHSSLLHGYGALLKVITRIKTK